MTEKKSTMDKKKLNSVEDEGMAKLKRKEVRNQSKKLKQMMKKRLIIRNLSFKIDEKKLKEIFSKYGEVVEAKIPLKADGKKRGFAFIQYKNTKSQIKAMKAMNFKEIYGRPIAIDVAVSKTTYQTKNQQYSDSQKKNVESAEANSDSESEDSENEDSKPKIKEEPDSDDSSDDDDDDNDEAFENNEDKKVKEFLKEFDADKELENSADKSSGEDSSEDDDNSDNDEKDSEISSDIPATSNKLSNKKQSHDVSEGKTVFIRNVSFSTVEEDLQEIMQRYGETQYCLLCMDPYTDRPRGTAFVKFKEKETADKLIEESSKDPGVSLDGRRLLCTYAISREELLKTKNETSKVTDKRNLRLLKCSLVLPGSTEAEGVSHTDMAKRAQLEIAKKQKLKNTNFFVSDKRLIIHNIPKNITNKDLVTLFKKAAGKGAVIKEARVMRDFKKTDAQGNSASRGFGFVSFTEHEHALKALMELNNNPKIFTSQKRPIVEFSVENSVALQSQERRRERNIMRNKKEMEVRQEAQTEDNSQMTFSQVTKYNVKRKNKPKGSLSNKKIKQRDVNTSSGNTQTAKPAKKKQKQKKRPKNKKNQGIVMNSDDKHTLSELRNKYKEKLLNEYS